MAGPISPATTRTRRGDKEHLYTVSTSILAPLHLRPVFLLFDGPAAAVDTRPRPRAAAPGKRVIRAAELVPELIPELISAAILFGAAQQAAARQALEYRRKR